VLALFLSFCCFTLTGCENFSAEGLGERLQELFNGNGDNGEEEPVDTVKVSDAYFGIAYYSNGKTFNPVTDNANVNSLLKEALYEGLFEISNNFTAQNVLCEDYRGDGTEFTFTLKPDVQFWSGEILTASDVAASYKAAKENDKSPYHDRLSGVSSIEALNRVQVRIKLSSPNINFPKLLDIPIYREGSDEEGDFADGTGPYKPKRDGTLFTLEAHENWNGGFLGTIRHISILNITKPDAASSGFLTGELSMMREPRIAPDGSSSRTSGSSETYSTSSASLHFLGFNFKNGQLAEPLVRQALSIAIPRQTICDVALQNYADPAVLPVNPQPDVDGLEPNMGSDVPAANELIKEAKLENEVNISLLVNENNSFKCAAAELIVGAWNSIDGVTATLNEVSYNSFTSALESGSFDVYYGETQLKPDFDLRPLLSANGRLNYGGYSSEKVSKAIAGARKGEDVSAMYRILAEEVPIASVAFEKGQLVLRKGIISNFSPLPYNAFAGQENWTIPEG